MPVRRRTTTQSERWARERPLRETGSTCRRLCRCLLASSQLSKAQSNLQSLSTFTARPFVQPHPCRAAAECHAP